MTLHVNLKAAATSAQISSAELELSFNLPAEYARFLLENNGGECQGWGCSIVHPVHGRIGVLLEKFLSVDAPDIDSDLVESYKYYVDSERIPAWFLPIAADIGTNMLGINVNTAAEGKIFFWDHEREFLDDNGVFEVASSLNGLLKIIQKLP